MNARALLTTGWGIALVVAILMVVLRGTEDLRAAIVFAVIAIAMLLWARSRLGRGAAITSLVLGLLWTLQFVGYSIASAGEDTVDVGILLTDILAVVGGVVIVVGAVRALRDRSGSIADTTTTTD